MMTIEGTNRTDYIRTTPTLGYTAHEHLTDGQTRFEEHSHGLMC